MDEFIIEKNVLKKYIGQGGNVVIPYGVSIIENGAFQGCKGLTSAVFPFNLGEIGDDAFRGCSNLETITFYGGFTDIGTCAFRDCPNLKRIICFNGADFEYPIDIFETGSSNDTAAFDVDFKDIEKTDICFLMMPDHFLSE